MTAERRRVPATCPRCGAILGTCEVPEAVRVVADDEPADWHTRCVCGYAYGVRVVWRRAGQRQQGVAA